MYSGIAFTEVSLLFIDSICWSTSVPLEIVLLVGFTEFLDDTVLEVVFDGVVSFNVDVFKRVVEDDVVVDTGVVSCLVVVLV